jgi:long-chain acyl-CoA synthetase
MISGGTDTIMANGNQWVASYPEAARKFDDSSIGVSHLAEVLRVAAVEYGARPAVSTQLPNGACATLSFEEIDRLTDDFATYLRESAGVQAGDVVAQMSPNCIDFLLVTFGILKAGCVCTNINPLYTAPEMEHQLKDSKAKVLIVMEQFGDRVDAIIGHTFVQQVVTSSVLDFFPPLKKAFMGFMLRKVKKMVPNMRTDHIAMADALKDGASRRRSGGIDVDAYWAGQGIDDTALYQYTGGTTGRSKGAELSHRNVLFNAAVGSSMIVDEVETRDNDCALVVLPLYHITAFVLVMVLGLRRGMHSVMVPSPRPPGNLRAAFENHAITHFSGINTLFAALLQEPWCTREVLRHLRFCGSGGAAQHVALAERWEALTGVPIHQGYGLTECAGVLTLNPAGGNRLGTAGVPVPLTRVKIVDSEGLALPCGEVGEIIAKGPTIMKGYLDQPEATANTIKDGWLHTGDLGVMDDDGYIRVVDRKKDMILVSGFNVFPNEIEDVIAELEGVVEVGVIGVPDERTEEAVKAFVVSSDPNMTAEQVIAHCKRSLTNYKRPKQVEFVSEIPKTPVGKVLRRSLREMNAK